MAEDRFPQKGKDLDHDGPELAGDDDRPSGCLGVLSGFAVMIAAIAVVSVFVS